MSGNGHERADKPDQKAEGHHADALDNQGFFEKFNKRFHFLPDPNFDSTISRPTFRIVVGVNGFRCRASFRTESLLQGGEGQQHIGDILGPLLG